MNRVDTIVDIGEVISGIEVLPETNRIKLMIKTFRKNIRNRQAINPSVLNFVITSVEDINLIKVLASLRLVKHINLRFTDVELQSKALDLLLIRDLKMDVHVRQYMVAMSLNRIQQRNPNADMNNDVVKALQHEYLMGFMTCMDYFNQSETSVIPADILKKIKSNMIITD